MGFDTPFSTPMVRVSHTFPILLFFGLFFLNEFYKAKDIPYQYCIGTICAMSILLNIPMEN